jgi:hypothetical protein
MILNTLVNALLCFFRILFLLGDQYWKQEIDKKKEVGGRYDSSIAVRVKDEYCEFCLVFKRKLKALFRDNYLVVSIDKYISFALLKVRNGTRTGLFHRTFLTGLPRWHSCTLVRRRVYTLQNSEIIIITFLGYRQGEGATVQL